jgi:hypothetical protein
MSLCNTYETLNTYHPNFRTVFEHSFVVGSKVDAFDVLYGESQF